MRQSLQEIISVSPKSISKVYICYFKKQNVVNETVKQDEVNDRLGELEMLKEYMWMQNSFLRRMHFSDFVHIRHCA